MSDDKPETEQRSRRNVPRTRRSVLAGGGSAVLVALSGCMVKKFDIGKIEKPDYVASINPDTYQLAPGIGRARISVRFERDAPRKPTGVVSISPGGAREGSDEVKTDELVAFVPIRTEMGTHELILYDGNEVMDRVDYEVIQRG